MLQRRLRAGWAGSIEAPPKAASFDGVLSIRRDGPDGTVRLGARSRVEPKDVDYLAATLRPTPNEPVLIAAPYALSQIAVDLMTSSGRGPNEAEALVQWMQEREDAWRA